MALTFTQSAQPLDCLGDPSDPCMKSATELSALIAARQLSSTEVVDAFLARIAKLEPQLNSYVNVHGEAARAAASQADKAISSGCAIGPLHGVPVSVMPSPQRFGWQFVRNR